MEGNDNFSKIVKTWQINVLVGKVMLLIEASMGLSAQSDALKSLIKQEIWREFNSGIYISKEMCEENFKANEKEGIQNITQ